MSDFDEKDIELPYDDAPPSLEPYDPNADPGEAIASDAEMPNLWDADNGEDDDDA